jgi:SAM-dependent methyltransferase/nucleoside phosphorylase
MTNIGPDNCISFEKELADIYDKTRHIDNDTDFSVELKPLCELIANSVFSKPEEVFMLDVGSGTGRLALFIAKHYEEYAQSHEKSPKLIIHCLDRSNEMLGRFKVNEQNLKADSFKFIKIVPVFDDIRDYVTTLKFDIVIAHWLFHTMADWPIAVYSINRLTHVGSNFLVITEASDLYSAIDGDFEDLQVKAAHVFKIWESYHQKRKEVIRELSGNGVLLPARARLGSAVVDVRINSLFRTLGWAYLKETPLANITWKTKYTARQIIEDIIRRRAFTNMRLFDNDSLFAKQYDRIANELLGIANADQSLDDPWEFETNFKVYSLIKQNQNFLSEGNVKGHTSQRNLIMEVLHEILNKRWLRRIPSVYSRESLWRRALKELLGAFPPEQFLSSYDQIRKNEFLGIYIASPVKLEDKTNLTIGNDTWKKFVDSNPELWNELTNSWECYEPIEIAILDQNIVQSQPTVKEEEYILSPALGKTTISRNELIQLSHALESCKNEEDRVVLCRSILKNNNNLENSLKPVKKFGAVEIIPQRSLAVFASGLERFTKLDKVNYIYIFANPAPIASGMSVNKTIGLLLCSSTKFNETDIHFLSSLFEIIFGEYLQDAYLEGWSFRSTVAFAYWSPLSKVKNISVKNNRPVILLVTATDKELEVFKQIVKDRIVSPIKLESGVEISKIGWHNATIYHTHTLTSGSSVKGASRDTIKECLQYLDNNSIPIPDLIALIGICYSLGEIQGHIFGNILISKSFRPLKLAINGKQFDPKAEPVDANVELLNALKSFSEHWHQKQMKQKREGKIPIHSECMEHPTPEFDFGEILTGDLLMRLEPSQREKLKDAYPNAIGGEMEGLGILGEVSNKSKVIIVKGVVDWGSIGKNDRIHEIGAINSISFMFAALSDSSFLDALIKLRK